MILNSQSQFQRDYIETLPHVSSSAELLQFADQSNMPGAYKDMFKTWVESYWSAEDATGVKIQTASAEERMRSFANYVDVATKAKIADLIQGDSEEANEQRQLAARGQLLLASTDGGKTFDTLINQKDLSKKDPLDYSLLSPTLRTDTTNLQEVLDEQALLHVRHNLVEQGFIVKEGSVNRGVLSFEVESRGKAVVQYTVEVDARADLRKPLQYKFTNTDHASRVISESILPEKLDELRAGAGFQLSPAEIELMQAQAQAQVEKFVESGGIAAMSLGGTPLPPPIIPQYDNTPQMAALVGAQESALANYANVMAAKARVARQQEQIDLSIQREQARNEQIQLQEDRRRAEVRQKARADAKARRKQQKSNWTGAAVGGGLLAGAGSAAMYFPSWITTIINAT